MKVILFVLVCVAMFLLPSFLSGGTVDHCPFTRTNEAEEVATETPVLREELVPICACESRGRRDAKPSHFNPDGSVIRGKINPQDIGMCQINLTYHEETAASMGYDLFKEADNIKYANYLYDSQGSAPWNWSKKCWQESADIASST